MIYDDLNEAISEINKENIDVVFLDMNDVDVKSINICISTQFVFLINNNGYIKNILDLLMMNYVIKDFINEQIKVVIKNVLMSKKLLSKQFKVCPITYSINKILGIREKHMFFINLDKVLYLYADKKDVNIVVEDSSIYKSKYTLKHWESKLSKNNFFRCHRSFLVNMKKVREIVPSFNSTFVLRFTNYKESIPVGRNYIEEFKRLIGM